MASSAKHDGRDNNTADYAVDTGFSEDGNVALRRPLYKGKVVVVGDYACGKSSIVHRYDKRCYLGIQEPTIAAAFSTKVVDLDAPGPVPKVLHPTGEPELRARSLVPVNAAQAHPSGSGKTKPVARLGKPDAALSAIEDAAEAPLHSPMACRVKLEIWDTAGSERYNSLMPMYFRDALVALVVFDATRRSSFERVARWVEAYRSHNDGAENDGALRPIIVCAKADVYAEVDTELGDASLEHGGPDRGRVASASAGSPPINRFADERRVEVPASEALALAAKMGLPLCFTSAKADWNIDLLFRDVATHIATVMEEKARRLQASGGKGRFGLRNGALGGFGGTPGSIMLAEDPMQREFDTRYGRRNASHAGPAGKRSSCKEC